MYIHKVQYKIVYTSCHQGTKIGGGLLFPSQIICRLFCSDFWSPLISRWGWFGVWGCVGTCWEQFGDAWGSLGTSPNRPPASPGHPQPSPGDQLGMWWGAMKHATTTTTPAQGEASSPPNLKTRKFSTISVILNHRSNTKKISFSIFISRKSKSSNTPNSQFFSDS